MSKVQAQTKSVKELLTGVKYDIDFYQRGYEWTRRNVEELLNDFEAEFLSNYAQEHEPWQVANYRHYFLGTIITIVESGKKIHSRWTTAFNFAHAPAHLLSPSAFRVPVYS